MNIAFVGLSGVPYSKRAVDARINAFAKTFKRLSDSVTIYNRAPSQQKDQMNNFSNDNNEITIVEIINQPKSPFWIIRLLIEIISYPIECYRLFRENRRRKIDVIHVYSGHFFEYLHYYLIAKFIGAKTVYQYVEFRSTIQRKNFYHKINGYLCDRYGFFLFDGIICISNYLENHVKELSYSKPTIKVPPICDFDYFDSIRSDQPKEKCIVYCGSADYMEVIETIIQAYKRSNCTMNGVSLSLIVSGSTKSIYDLMQLASESPNILVRSKLNYSDLVKHLKSAEALLIPLRNTIQDIARFPNKICEYTACRNVIITTNFGEIPFFFEDKKNALIANEFSQECLSEKFNWIFDNGKAVNQLRQAAYLTGKENFNIENYMMPLNSFMTSVIS